MSKGPLYDGPIQLRQPQSLARIMFDSIYVAISFSELYATSKSQAV